MKVDLFDFQQEARLNLQAKIQEARHNVSISNPKIISFSAPTGSGKTTVMTALFEDILFGDLNFEAQSDAVILWVSDIPELNEQTRLKIESQSSRIRVRHMININADFDAEKLAGGCIYFVNTQKLGTDKLLTRCGDKRQYTIWQTFSNTAVAIPEKFYVVIDEAHRGMRNDTTANAFAKTIMQKFLLGSSDDGLCQMPLVIGVSATPQRFDDLVAGTTHTQYKVVVEPEEVRKSGLLKSRILVHYPQDATQAEMTMLASATDMWQKMTMHWEAYCQSQNDITVKPILVIQVQDGNEEIITETSMESCVNIIENTLKRKLLPGEVVHTFTGAGDQEIAGHKVQRIEASRIEENEKVGVVFFKMSLSTGWDCPRAEAMMSFRRAYDHTYIAQLLGRMVRTPLARRVETDALLNDVHLFLPHYDQDAVLQVINDLDDKENVPPADVGTSREMVVLNKRSDMAPIFQAIKDRGLVTYRVGTVRSQSALRRYMALGRGLNRDRIDAKAENKAAEMIVRQMIRETERLRKNGSLSKLIEKITELDLRTAAFKTGLDAPEEFQDYAVAIVSDDINQYFEQAGRLLGNGLNIKYWHKRRKEDANKVKRELVALTRSDESMDRLESLIQKAFNRNYDKHRRILADLGEKRRKHYDRLRLATPEPQSILWVLPDSIDFQRSTTAAEYEKHLYIENNGEFRADLGSWERGVLEEELRRQDVVGWLRNLDRKSWAIEIPYRISGVTKRMFPDLFIVRRDAQGYQFDLLEPHDHSRTDNCVKAVGLAEFAERHWNLFGRIQLIRKIRSASGIERFYRLDMSEEIVRSKVMEVITNTHLDRIFDEHSI